jgi:hypothetical protein
MIRLQRRTSRPAVRADAHCSHSQTEPPRGETRDRGSSRLGTVAAAVDCADRQASISRGEARA